MTADRAHPPTYHPRCTAFSLNVSAVEASALSDHLQYESSRWELKACNDSLNENRFGAFTSAYSLFSPWKASQLIRGSNGYGRWFPI